MRKFTFLMAFVLAGLWANAQNLLSNGDFETPAGFLSVAENGATVLQRVTQTQDATAAVTFPTVGTAASVPAGVWVKRAWDGVTTTGANTNASDEQKAVVSNSDSHAGSTSINLQINGNAAKTLGGVGAYTNQMIQQKIAPGLDVTKKYLLTFWARADNGDPVTGLNAVSSVSVFITDGGNKALYARPVLLTGGTSWTQYSVVFDLPQFKANLSTSPAQTYATATYLAMGIRTSTGTNLTNYAGVFLDDISLTAFTPTPITRYVKPTATGTGDGTSWANAAGTSQIQAMIDAVAANTPSNGEVQFSAGTYNLTAPIQLRDGVNLTGQYKTDNSGTRDMANTQTILDGGNARQIMFAGDVAAVSVPFLNLTFVNGFVMQNGTNIKGTSATNGSAVALSLNCYLQNCIIRNNNGTGTAGGTSASTTNGAAVFIRYHQALLNGDALWNMGSALVNCVIVNNSSTNNAAGVWSAPSSYFSVLHCVIANNKSTDPSLTLGIGGIYFDGGIRYSMLANTILYNNLGTINTTTNGTIGVTNSGNNINTPAYQLLGTVNNYWSESTTATPYVPNNNSATQLTADGTAGVSPFVAPTTYQGYDVAMTNMTTANWRLKSTSNCIDAGANNKNLGYPVNYFYVNFSTDMLGTSRVVGANPDLGAYETYDYTVALASSDITKGTVSGPKFSRSGSPIIVTATPLTGYQFSQWSDGTNTYTTNPLTITPTANVTLTASFIPATGLNNVVVNDLVYVVGSELKFRDIEGTVQVYNTVGKLLVSKKNTANSITLNESGVYLVRIVSDKGIQTQKVLVK